MSDKVKAASLGDSDVKADYFVIIDDTKDITVGDEVKATRMLDVDNNKAARILGVDNNKPTKMSDVDNNKDTRMIYVDNNKDTRMSYVDNNKDTETRITEVTEVKEKVAEVIEKPKPKMSPLQQLKSLWYIAVVVVTPLVMMPLPIVIGTPAAKCAFVITIMAVYWVTEALPIPVTSLIPVILLPTMGVLSAKRTSGTYLNDTSILFLGGLTISIAIEEWNLHRRLALNVMKVVGSEPKWLLLGMMGVTCFLSMWISNTAATTMMMPIVQAILDQLEVSDVTDSKEIPGEKTSTKSKTEKEEKEEKDGHLQMRKAMSISIAYASSAGGIGCLIGTPPNIVFMGQLEKTFEAVGLSPPVTFATWFIYGAPLSVLILITLWIWLQLYFFRCKGGCNCIFKNRGQEESKKRSDKVKAFITSEVNKLGPITFPEGTVLFFFILLVVLWLTRDLSNLGGWGYSFKPKYVSDSTPAIIAAIMMFVLPSRLPDILYRGRRQGPSKPLTPLLSWNTINSKMPWSVYLLLGGGFAIAEAATVSGLSAWMGQKLLVFGDLNPWVLVMIISYIVSFATEITSNVAIATVVLPVVKQMAMSMKVNPLIFMFPATIASSFAFMLPVGTPANAIVFSYGALRVIDMVKCGFVINIVTVPLLMFATVTWGNAFFHFDVLPPEFLPNISTTLSP